MPSQLMFTLIPLSIPTIWLAVSCYANAWLYCLFDALQSSKTKYNDNEDEFDFDAEPPVSEVFVPRVEIFRKFVQMMRGIDPRTLSRTANLLHSLGNTTVICAIDKEGTLAKPFPLPEAVFMLRDEPMTLEVGADYQPPHNLTFLENDWHSFMSSLKPIGLHAVLHTDSTHVDSSLAGPYHIKRPALTCLGPSAIPCQMYLGNLGWAIGFVDSAVTMYRRVRHIIAYSPTHISTFRPPGFGPAEVVYRKEK